MKMWKCGPLSLLFVPPAKGGGMEINMQEIKVQFAVFFKQTENRPDTLWYGFNDELKNIMESVPTIVPVPLEAPAEIPIVQTKSNDNTFIINISRNRADFIINLLDRNVSRERREYFFKLFLSEICKFKEIIRVGIVEEVVMGEIISGVKCINQKYFSGKQTDAIELSFRKNSNCTINDISCNNIVEIASVPITNAEGEQEEGFVRIARDINNVPSTKSLSKTDAEAIVIFALGEYIEDHFRELVL